MKKDITPVERKLLSSIKQMPGIYIGTKNLLFLEHFIHGYDFAMICHDIKNMHNIMPEGFEEYIEAKYRSNTTKNLFMIIAENSENDSDAFDTFFEFLDEYLLSVDLQPLPIWNSTVDKIEDIKNSFAKERNPQ